MNCTSCGEENRETAKFCDECGTPTGAEAPQFTPDDGAVRRSITIAFADLVGSTAFGEVVDAESARREMAAYH